MIFEWHEMKAARNVVKHGVPFRYAMRIFLGERRLDARDNRHNYGEERRVTVGEIEARVYVVASTMREAVARLISARRANGPEQRKYYETLSA